MAISESILESLNVTLGLVGRPHLILYDGQWLDTGCMEWSQLPSLPQLWSGISPELKGAFQRHQELQQWEYTNEPMAQMKEFFSREPDDVQAEWAEFNAKVEQANSPTFGRSRQAAGLSRLSLTPVRTILKDQPVIAYRAGIEWEGWSSTMYDTIVVAPTNNQFDILRFERTDGANRNLGTEDVIGKLKIVDEKYGIDIVGAAGDGVEFTLKRIPKGKEAHQLGRWLLGICPDLYEAPRSFPEGQVVLWWD